jgi:hypothetical protein
LTRINTWVPVASMAVIRGTPGKGGVRWSV